MQKQTITCSSDRNTSDSLHFCMLYIINMALTIYMKQFCFLYMLNYPACVYLLSETDKEGTHARNCFTLARLKIVPTIKNLYHIQCQCVDELSS